MESEKITQSGIILAKYDEKWQKEFLSLSNVLNEKLKPTIISIEHVGSTSVKGLRAKPIIDLDIVVEELFLTKVKQQLSNLGYIYEGDKGIKGREAFARKDKDVPWCKEHNQWMEHHLYVCISGNEELQRHLNFRNYLRDHPKAVKEYELLKLGLAKSARTREEYTEGKSEFIERILTLVR